MDSLNEMFFNHKAAEGLTYEDILEDVQKYYCQPCRHPVRESNPDNVERLLKEFISVPHEVQLFHGRYVHGGFAKTFMRIWPDFPFEEVDT